MTALLEVRDIEVAYGAIVALHGITIDVQKGEIVTLIGANGAGKTTTLRTISGLLHPVKGHITFNGRNITAAKPHVITAMVASTAGFEVVQVKVVVAAIPNSSVAFAVS